MKHMMLTIAAVLVLVAAGCSSTDEQFRDSLLDDGFTEAQVDCVMEGLDGAGIDPASLTDNALGDDDPPQGAIDVTVGCLLGLDSNDLGVDLAETGTDTGASTEGIDDYGDDPELDLLFDQCEAGDGAACDSLYFSSPFDSRYEAFGNTCGGKIDPPPLSCEDALP